MKLLLHTCCGPCAVYPIGELRKADVTVMGYFYPHNIHPHQECEKRKNILVKWAKRVDLKVIYEPGYDLEGFLRNAVFRETDRCRLCYHARLTATAKVALRGKFDAFSSTLLYSKFQNHTMIRDTGDAVGKAMGIRFFYEDFRVGWKKGIEASKALGMYRQSYCGCIYSEKERYFKPSGNDSPPAEIPDNMSG